MSEPEEEMTMRLRRYRNIEVISSDIALKLADMVFREIHGDETVENGLPLTVTDLGDRWRVDSTFRKPSSLDLKDPEGGQLTMTIQKTNGRILNLARNLMLPFPPPTE